MAGMGLLFSALSGGAQGYGNAIAQQQRFDDERSLMQERMKLEEEKQLRIEERTQARKVEPMRRFSGLLGAKQNEEVPMEAEPVTKSTAEGAKAAGYESGLVGMTRDQVAAYKDPDMLAQFDRQMDADKRLAEEKASGKTRKRSFDEAIDAARQEAAASDPEAFAAGEAMFSADRKDAREEKKLSAQERIKQAEIQQRDRAEAGKDRRHAEQMDALYAKIEALGKKEGGERTALIQNAEYLKSLGYSADKIEKFIFDKKELPLEDVAAKILAGDKMGDMTPDQAAQKAIALRNALQKSPASTPSIPAASGDRPPLSSFMKGGQAPQNNPSRTSTGTIKY